jgi:nucleotide-binding universal stress UspA family protein
MSSPWASRPTHGHRFISDLLYGSTADKVRHLVEVPVLLLKASL